MITSQQYEAMKAKLPPGVTETDLLNRLKSRGLLPNDQAISSASNDQNNGGSFLEKAARYGVQGLKSGIGLLQAPAAAVLPVFKKLDELSSYAAGKKPTELTPEQQQKYNQFEQEGYQKAPTFLGAATALSTGNIPLAAKVAAGGRAAENLAINPALNLPQSETPLTDIAKEYINFRALTLAKGPASGAATMAGISALNQLIDYKPTDHRTLEDRAAEVVGMGALGGITTPVARKIIPNAEEPVVTGTKQPSMVKESVANAAKTIPEQMISRMSGLTSEAQNVIKGAPDEVTAIQKNYPQAKMQTVNDFESAFKKVESQISESGPYYKQFRESNAKAVFNNAKKSSILADAGLEWVPEGLPQKLPDGTYRYPGHLAEISTAKKIALQPQEVGLLESWWQKYGAAPELRADAYLTGRQELAKFGKYDKGMPLGGEALRTFADKLYSAYSEPKNTQPELMSLAAADKASAPLRGILNEAKSVLYKFDKGTQSYEISDAGITKLLNATTGMKRGLLDKLEAVQPGITRKIRILNAVNEIMTENKPGQYQKAGAAVVGSALGSALPGIGTIGGGAAGWFIGNLISSPTLFAEALKTYGRKKGIQLDDVSFKIERGMKLNAQETIGVKKALENMQRVYLQQLKTHEGLKKIDPASFTGENRSPSLDTPLQDLSKTIPVSTGKETKAGVTTDALQQAKQQQLNNSLKENISINQQNVNGTLQGNVDTFGKGKTLYKSKGFDSADMKFNQITLEPLAAEAKKYKSADAFINGLKKIKTSDSPSLTKATNLLLSSREQGMSMEEIIKNFWHKSTNTPLPVKGKPTPIDGTSLFVEDIPF